jgi:hypothetical protein
VSATKAISKKARRERLTQAVKAQDAPIPASPIAPEFPAFTDAKMLNEISHETRAIARRVDKADLIFCLTCWQNARCNVLVTQFGHKELCLGGASRCWPSPNSLSQL